MPTDKNNKYTKYDTIFIKYLKIFNFSKKTLKNNNYFTRQT